MLTIGKLNELIKKLAPAQYNSIIIDNAVAVKEHKYCYIHAETQKVEFRSESLSIAVDSELEKQLTEAIFPASKESGQHHAAPYIPVEKTLIAQIKEAPRLQNGSFLDNAKRKFNELVNGGRSVDHNNIRLLMENGRLAKTQPDFAIREECSISNCPTCGGNKAVSHTSKIGTPSVEVCDDCDGLGRVASITWFTPIVKERNVSIIRCLEGEIDNMKTGTLEAHKGDDTTPKRMLTRINGEERELYPDELRPFLDMMHDKTGEDNAIEDIYYRIIPCYTFVYRNILTSELHNGVVVEPYGNAEIILDLESGNKVVEGIKDRIKGISRFFGNLGKTDTYKDKEDLRRTIRLLIAIAVADGNVSEEEKQTLTLSIRNIQQFSASEQEELLTLLGKTDSGFLTDNDFAFHSRENAEMTIARMQEIASSDGMVDKRERDIVERLKFKY